MKDKDTFLLETAYDKTLTQEGYVDPKQISLAKEIAYSENFEKLSNDFNLALSNFEKFLKKKPFLIDIAEAELEGQVGENVMVKNMKEILKKVYGALGWTKYNHPTSVVKMPKGF
jgi:hypothetical protein